MAVLFRGKTEAEILEFLTLEGELIVELDALSPEVKRNILANLRKMKKLPEWMQSILLEDINTAVENRISIMETIVRAHKRERDVARERKT